MRLLLRINNWHFNDKYAYRSNMNSGVRNSLSVSEPTHRVGYRSLSRCGSRDLSSLGHVIP